MSNLVDHATRELALSGVDEDIYGDMTSKAVLELLEVFANQGHTRRVDSSRRPPVAEQAQPRRVLEGRRQNVSPELGGRVDRR